MNYKPVILFALAALCCLFLAGIVQAQQPDGDGRAIGDDCTEPIQVNLTQDLPYLEYGQTTCGRGNSYDTTCLGSYDDGEDIIYQLNVSTEFEIQITMTPNDAWAAMGLFDDCPDVGNCMESVTYANVGYVIQAMTINTILSPGTYYLMMDSWPAPACFDFDLAINQVVPVDAYPFIIDFEDGEMPVEFVMLPGGDAGIRTDADAALNSDYGLLFEGNTQANWGPTPVNVNEAFDSTKVSHFGTINIEVVPTGEPGTLKMQFDLQQGYSYTPNYCWFRVMVDSIVIADENGFTYYQPFTHNDPFSSRTWDLGAYQSAPFTITLQSSCKYYENYYEQGDIVHVDDFEIWYELPPGKVEGYVFNGNGIPIPDANVGLEGSVTTSSGIDGFYLLEHVPFGMQEIYAWKQGYNMVSASVNVPSGGVANQDFILTQPTMIISPTLHYYTLNPFELYSTQTGIQNSGDGPLEWSAVINYPSGDTLDWLSLEWYEGVVPPDGGLENIPTHFNAANTTSGEVYTADIVFTSNPDVGTLTIPCEMVVLGDPLIPPAGLQVSLLNDVTGEVRVSWQASNRDFQYFIVKRDGALLASTINQFVIDYLPGYGEYCYTVQSSYDEGFSIPAGPECILWPNPQVFINPNHVEEWVWIDQQAVVSTNIINLGIGTLTYSFPDFTKDDKVLEYCPGSGGCDEFIQNVSIGNINNTTGCKNYSNFTNLSATVQRGVAYPISISVGNPVAEDILGIWVDWDQDEVWAQDEMIQTAGDPFSGFTAEIIPPDGSPAGYTRMRIRLQWGGVLDPCGTTAYGEVEDYSLYVLGGFITDVQPSSGIIAEGSSQVIMITYDASAYPEGDFSRQLLCETNDPSSPVSVIYNTMHVIVPAELVGNVKDGNTGVYLPGVSVTAGNWQAETDEHGHYSMYLDEGIYDITFQKLGYQTVIVEDTFVQQGEITPLDIQMFEEPYPVSFVLATVNEEDTECLVEWSLPYVPLELYYDDGEAEELVVWADPLNENAVKFTPLGYPMNLIGGRLNVGDGSFPAGNWLNSEFALLIYDDDGNDGMPGTLMDSMTVEVQNFEWIEFKGDTITFLDGDFYISMMQLNPSPNAPPLGVDFTSPVAYRSYSRLQGDDWILSPYQDFMIRAYVTGPATDDMPVELGVKKVPEKLPPGAEGRLYFTKNGLAPIIFPGLERETEFNLLNNTHSSNRDLVSYDLMRVSDFNPDLGPQTGVFTLIGDDINAIYYNDTAFGALPMGWFAYAVQANYTNGDTSEWIYSNIVGHLKEVRVDFQVTLTTGELPDEVEITMAGEDYPYSVYSGITDTNGLLFFNDVWKGTYTIHAYKVGYELYEISNENIQSDMSYSLTLGEKRYPALNFWVDPLTSMAYWDYPIVTAIREDFDGSQFLPSGWQIVSQGVGWFLTTDGSSPNWTVPAWDSRYACANDDKAGSANNGCCDYLVTPAVDLRESEEFSLMFDSYYDGAYGEIANVEFSNDGGNTWYILMALTPNPGGWEQIEIDLSSLSGPSGAYPVWFAFHADDDGEWASGWAVDNIVIANGLAGPIDFYMFLDGAFVNSTEQTYYQYPFLTYGITYEASVAAHYTSGLSEKVYYPFTSTYLTPPRNLRGETFDDAVQLWWQPPLEPDGVFVLLTEKTRTVHINPHDDYSPKVRTIKIMDNSIGSRDQWDVHYSYPTIYTDGETGAETDGDYLYTTQWNAGNGTFFKYDLDGTYLETFVIPDCRDLRDLAYDPDNSMMFGSNASDTVWKMDFIDQVLVETFFAPTEVRAIAFDSDEIGFWANNWDTDITLFDMTGSLISSFPIGTWGSYYGFAYDNWTDGGPYLWGFSQDGSGAILVQIDLNTGTEVTVLDVLPILGGSEIAGGLFTMCSMIYNNVVTIGGVLQNEMLFGLELGPCQGPPLHWHVPENLIGYKVYRDLDWVGSVPYYGEDTSTYYDTGLDPYTYEYDVSALYTLSTYGFPGEVGESMMEGPFYIQVQYGYPLPFEETWSLGSFELNEWDHSGNWIINNQSGNPPPSTEFSWEPILTNYKSSLTSHPIDGVNLPAPWVDGCIWLDFDIKLIDRNMTGQEKLRVEIGNDFGWFEVMSFDNAQGGFDWQHSHVDISSMAFGEIFRVRFVGEGTNSIDIQSWLIDNILIYRDCSPPRNLNLEIQNCIDVLLTWDAPYVCDSARKLVEYDIYVNLEYYMSTTDTFYIYTAGQNGTYRFQLFSVYEDCVSDSSVKGTIDVVCVGINTPQVDDWVNVYPVPTSETLYIQAKEEIRYVSLLNNMGTIVYSNYGNESKELKVNTKTFIPGFYFLKIETKTKIYSKKILVIR